MKRIFLMTVVVFAGVITTSAQVTFAPAQDYVLKAPPYRAAIGDFNGDGKPDLAVLSILGGTVSTLLNHGDGTFAPPRDFTALTPDPADPGYLFSGIRLGDVNGDHKLDVIVTQNVDPNTGAGVINVLLGNGDGTFDSPITTVVNSYAYKLVGVGDFNNDGRLDVACICDDSTNTVVSVVLFLGNGDGTFARASSSQAAVGYPGRIDVALADVNHDGTPDVIIPTGTFVEVFLGKGDGSFQSPFQANTPAPALFVSAGDINHDGTPDLLSTSSQVWQYVPGEFGLPGHWIAVGPPGGVSALMAKGDGTFTALTFAAELGVSVEGDFDGDGNLDFVAQEIQVHNTPGLFDSYLGDGKGNFSSRTEINQPITTPLAADFDGDGFADLVWLGSSSLQVALNNSSTFTLAASVPGPPIPAGGTASYTIDVAQQHGQGAVVTLICSAPPGYGIGCSVSPQSAAAGTTATLSVTATGASAGLLLPSSRRHQFLQYALWLPLGAVFFGGISLGQTRRKKFIGIVTGSVLATGLIFQAACGGGSSSPNNKMGTPPGTYTITVTGTADTVSRSTTVKLTVQ